MAKIPIGLQLYSVREDCAKDLEGVLRAVAKMGYEGVEFAGYYGRTAQQLRSLLDENGLKCCGTHTGLDTIMEQSLPATIEFNQTLGNPYLIVPGLPEKNRSSKAAWLESASVFNGVAEKLKPLGMRTGYHNHGVEFQPMDGEQPWDIFFGNTRQDVVMQFDVGNAMHGGARAEPFLERYPGRATTVHVKEYSATNDNALIGEGDVDWDRVFGLIESQGGTKWYIVEQESYAYPPLQCVEKCLQNLKAMGK